LSAAVRKMREELGELIDLEKAVIRLELKYKANDLRALSTRWIAGAVLCTLGAFCFVIAAVLVLTTVMPSWIGAALVGAGLTLIGALMFRRSRASKGRRAREAQRPDEGRELPVRRSQNRLSLRGLVPRRSAHGSK
jgi:hypothetical protein